MQEQRVEEAREPLNGHETREHSDGPVEQTRELRTDVSGLYRWRSRGQSPGPRTSESLRLDVDGRYPQMVASGTISEGIHLTHWISDLSSSGPNVWVGNIWYTDVSPAGRVFPYTNVEITVTSGGRFSSQRTASVTLSGSGGATRERTFGFISSYFHPVDFEFDSAAGEQPALAIDTCAHPNRPAALPCENLSIPSVFRRAGFRVTSSPKGVVPLAGAGSDAVWSDLEMHDAMQTYWSRFVSQPQWAMWVFFASLHDTGASLGGVMFDDIGPNHRQGTAIFNDSFIANPPARDPNPAAWAQRMAFWTACHEMGHAFNLAHSWQKSLALGSQGPWIPLANAPEARSFMNYPFRVAGGQTAFFADFEYRFSDEELLFMRHAPERFVQQGNADWFDDHGFQGMNTLPESTLGLELRVNRERSAFEFMEPVVLETKLTNTSSQPQLVDKNLLAMPEAMVVILKKDSRPARRFVPYSQYCWTAEKKVLMPGESMYNPLFVSAGQNGWDVAEPGYYTVRVALHLEDEEEDLISNPLRLRVEPPPDDKRYDAEYLAQDFFSEDVGRTLWFDGSRFLGKANDTLHEVAERLSDRKVALHANAALGNALARECKQLNLDKGKERATSAATAGARITVRPPEPEEARRDLGAALTQESDAAAKTFGHIKYRRYVNRFSNLLANEGEDQKAAEVQDTLYETLANRNVPDRILKEIKDRREHYAGS